MTGVDPVCKPHPKGKGCWYYIEIHACPICGRSETFRERRYGVRPDDPRERFAYLETSGCWSHFL